MVNGKSVDEIQSWEEMIDQANEFSDIAKQKGQAVSTELYLEAPRRAEALYLQAIAAMRVWKDTHQFQWIDALIELSDLYLWLGKRAEAIYLLSVVSEIYKKMKWDFETMDGWTMLVEQWLNAGEHEKALELIGLVARRKEDFVREQVALEREAGGDPVAREQEIRERLDNDDLSPFVEAANQLKSRLETTKKLTDKALESVLLVLDRLVDAAGGELVDTFEKVRKKDLSNQLLDEAQCELAEIELKKLLGG